MAVNGNHTKLTDTEIGRSVQQKMLNEETLSAFDNILNRINTLENAVERLTTLLERGPGLVSMTVDMVDEGIQKASENGVNIEERLSNALTIAEKLTAPEVMEKLDGIIELSNQAPGLVSMTMDMVDEGVKKAAENGVNIEERLGTALTMAEKLTAPEMMEKLDGVLEFANQAPGLMSMTIDMVDEAYRKAAAHGIDIDERAKLLAIAAEKLTNPTMIQDLTQFIEMSKRAPGMMAMFMDMADHEYQKLEQNGINLQALGHLASASGKAVSTAAGTEYKKMGLFGLMKALNDPDRQKALGFLMELTKQLGKEL